MNPGSTMDGPPELEPHAPWPAAPASAARPPRMLPVKRTADGRVLLNVGCGVRMHWAWNNLDFSPYARLRRHPRLARALNRAGLLSDLRYARLQQIDPEIVAWNAARGLPFADGTFDVVYHSHMLEHLPRGSAAAFLVECRRVLRPAGLLRVVVPDLELAIAQYTAALARLRSGDRGAERSYDGAVDGMFAQMTSDAVNGTEAQSGFLRAVERWVRGDASRVGQRHRWMYDEVSLTRLLAGCGYVDIRKTTAGASGSGDWRCWGLDTNEDGSPYKPESLYMEARRTG